MLATQGLNSVQVVSGQGHNAALALHHLNQHCGGGGGDGGFHRCEVVGRNLLEALGQGGKTIAQAFAARCCQRSERAAMKAALEGDDFVGITLFHAAHVAARQLYAGLVGFCTGVAEKGLAVVAR